MMSVVVVNGHPRIAKKEAIYRLVCSLLAITNNDKKSISVNFVGRAKMKSMNLEYRDKNRATDVLSFPGSDDFDHLGDLFICPDVVLKRSRFREAMANKMCKKLIIHGFTHLLGFDHETVFDYQVMRMKEACLWGSVCRFKLNV